LHDIGAGGINMTSLDVRVVVTEEAASVCARRPAEGLTASGSASAQALLAFYSGEALPAEPGQPCRQISIEGWARQTFGKELADFLKPLAWYPYDDFPDDHGRATERPDECLVGGWLGGDSDAVDA
jgi:hypothetical protein